MLEILRNLARRKLRSTLTIAGIVIGIFALTTMGAISAHFNQLLTVGVNYYGSRVTVGPPDQQLGALLPISTAGAISQVDGVRAVFPAYRTPLKPGSSFSFGGPPEGIVNGIPDETALSQPRITIARGRDLAGGRNGEVVLGSTVATDLKKQVGGTVELPVQPADAPPDFAAHQFTVVGILQETGTGPDANAYVDDADARLLLRDTLPPAFRSSLDLTQVAPGFTVYGAPGASVAQLDAVATRINNSVPGVKAARPSVAVRGFTQFVSTFTAITTAAALLALIIGGLSVINTMVMAVSERVREIGLKKAVGASGSRVLREYLMESAVIGLIGGVIGFLLGFGLTSVVDAAGGAGGLNIFLVTPALMALVIGFAVVLGSLAGVLPAIRAARLDPVAALRMTT
jgi:putative ABC transport system permease protein